MKLIVLVAQYTEIFVNDGGFTALQAGSRRVRADRMEDGASKLHLAVLVAGVPVGTRSLPLTLQFFSADGHAIGPVLNTEVDVPTRIATLTKVMSVEHKFRAGTYQLRCEVAGGEDSDRVDFELYDADPDAR